MLPEFELDRNYGGSLVERCLKVACQSKQNVDAWKKQKRTLERMPSHLADLLLYQLHNRNLLSAPLLESFKGCVEQVNFSGDPMVDAIWVAYLGGFDHLRVLQLADCKSLNNGAIWPLSGLRQLEELDLSRCTKITDEGLEHLLCLGNINKLGISETGIGPVGIARLCNMSNLTFLDLGGLPVSDCQLASLQVLSGLRYLDLWGTNISDDGACYLKAFWNLQKLNLSWTNITIVPPLLSLMSLNLSNCTVASIFDGLGEQSANLDQLYLSGSVILDPLKALASQVVGKLSLVALSECKVSSLSFLHAIVQLQKVDLSSTGVTDAVLSTLAECGKELRYLNLGRTKVGPEGVAALSGKVPKLEVISLNGTAVDDSVFLYLGMMPSLKMVDLSHTKVKGANIKSMGMGKCWSMRSLQQLNHLQCLDLRNTGIKDKSCQQLASLKRLSNLFLRSDFLSDVSLHSLSALQLLVTLYFQGSVLTDSGLSGFQPPPLLQELDLTDCWLLTETSLLQFAERNHNVMLRHELINGKIGNFPRHKQSVKLGHQRDGSELFSLAKFNERDSEPHAIHSNRNQISWGANVRDRKITQGTNAIKSTRTKGEVSNTLSDQRRKYSLLELLQLKSSCSSPALSIPDYAELQGLILRR